MLAELLTPFINTGLSCTLETNQAGAGWHSRSKVKGVAHAWNFHTPHYNFAHSVWCENMATDTAEVEVESEKQLNNDEGEFQNEERFIAVDSDSVCDTNILSPTTTTNRSLKFQMTDDTDYEETSFTDSNFSSQVFEAETEGVQSQAAEQTSSVSVLNGKINRPYMQQKRQMRILSSQGNYETKVDTFEEAFSKQRYAGSFRFQFFRDEFASHENRAQVNSADTTNQSLESQIVNNDDNQTCSTDAQRSQAFAEQPQVLEQSVPTSRPHGQRQKRMRILSSQGSNESNVDNFEEAFSKHRYAGSFRLRFCKDEVIAQENRTQICSSDPMQSVTANLQNEIDIQVLSEQTTAPCKQMVNSNNDSKTSGPGMEYEKGPVFTEVYTNEIEMKEDKR